MTSERAPGGGKIQHIADELRMAISDGTYPPEQRLPKQQDLVERFGVARETVRKAIGLLEREGLVKSVQGSGTTVLRQHRERASMVLLQPYIQAAFEAEDVTLDLFTLTAESMDAHVRTQVMRIHNHEAQPPRSIRVRVMVPDLDAHLAYPRSVSDPADPRPLKRHKDLIKRHAPALCDALIDLQDAGLVQEVEATVRTIPLTPSHKLYLLNHTTALHAMYKLIERDVTYQGEKLRMIDVHGLGSTLFLYRTAPGGPGIVDPEFVDEAQQWFDSYWEHLAHDATFLD